MIATTMAQEARQATSRVRSRPRIGAIAPHVALCLAYGFVAATVLVL